MESVKLAEHNRALIIEHAQAVYGDVYANFRQFSESSRWSVVIGKTAGGQYRAHVIVYNRPGSLEHPKLLKSGGEERLPHRALESLLENLMLEVTQRFFK